MGILIAKSLARGGGGGSYSYEELAAQAKARASKLPIVEPKGKHTLKIDGNESFFNPHPPMSDSYLRDKMTPKEFTESVKFVNDSVARSMVGLSRRFPPSQLRARRNIAKLGAIEAVKILNDKWADREVSFEYQAGQEHTEVTGIRTRGGNTRTSTRYSQDTLLYIKL